jgi:hypothetical protein
MTEYRARQADQKSAPESPSAFEISGFNRRSAETKTGAANVGNSTFSAPVDVEPQVDHIMIRYIGSRSHLLVRA